MLCALQLKDFHSKETTKVAELGPHSVCFWALHCPGILMQHEKATVSAPRHRGTGRAARPRPKSASRSAQGLLENAVASAIQSTEELVTATLAPCCHDRGASVQGDGVTSFSVALLHVFGRFFGFFGGAWSSNHVE